METETAQKETGDTPHRVIIRANVAWCNRTVIEDGVMAVDLSTEDLRRLVQYAYDQHGIVATPSYGTESYTAELARRKGSW